jgi:hypothetical protein
MYVEIIVILQQQQFDCQCHDIKDEGTELFHDRTRHSFTFVHLSSLSYISNLNCVIVKEIKFFV